MGRKNQSKGLLTLWADQGGVHGGGPGQRAHTVVALEKKALCYTGWRLDLGHSS